MSLEGLLWAAQWYRAWLSSGHPVGYVVAALLGLCVGSFLNVVIYRLPHPDLSIVRPRSRCPGCEAPVAWFDNLPVLSWVLLRGACRGCGQRISARYPFVEAICGVLAIVLVHRHGWSGEAAALYVFAVVLVAITFIDFDWQIIPNEFTIPGMILGLAFTRVSLEEARMGLLVGLGGLYAVAAVYYRLRHQEGLGMGDVKMMGMTGAFLGWEAVLFTLLVGSVTGSVLGVGAIALGRGEFGRRIPFGPFLAVGAMAWILGAPAWLASTGIWPEALIPAGPGLSGVAGS